MEAMEDPEKVPSAVWKAGRYIFRLTVNMCQVIPKK